MKYKVKNLNQDKKYIGVFDSGFGGLDILRGIIKIIPEYDYIYLGDTARAPYGNKSQEVIYKFTKEAIEFLFNNGCELIILACNTASSEALARLQKNVVISYNKKHKTKKNVLGILVPTVEVSLLTTKVKYVGLLATKSTINSKSFEREIKKLHNDVTILGVACPLLVPIIEEGEEKNKIIDLVLEKYLRELKFKDKAKNLDTLILGCTHYGLIEKQIKKNIKKIFKSQKIEIVNESNLIGKKLKDYLERHLNIANQLSKNQDRIFFTTDNIEKFEEFGSRFFGQEILVKKINL